ITAMPFQIAKHFVDPHASPVSAAGRARVWQIGRQQPRFTLTRGPIGQQAGRIAPLLRQEPVGPPAALTGTADQLRERLPAAATLTAHPMTAFLPQHIAPTPTPQLADDRNA